MAPCDLPGDTLRRIDAGPGGTDPLVPLTMHGDSRGQLVAIEGSIDVPFDIARVYYMFGGRSDARGFHAHRTLDQMLVCLVGSCRVVLDDGRGRSEHRLDRPDCGIMLPRMVWHEMHDLAAETVILVLASAHYDEADYIRDYDRFRDEAGTAAAR